MARPIPARAARLSMRMALRRRLLRRTLASSRWRRGQVPGLAVVYPVKWRIAIPRLQMGLDVSAALDDQELRLKPIEYREGSIRVQGMVDGKAVKGSGYLEMTGYTGPIAGMQANP